MQSLRLRSGQVLRSALVLGPLTATLTIASPAAQESRMSRPQWDLASEFRTADAWDRAVADVDRRISAFSQRRTESITGAAQLADLLDESRTMRGLAGRLARFALLTHAADKTDDVARSRFIAATGLEARVEAAVGWLDTDMHAIDVERLREWQRTEPRFAAHGWRLARLRTLSGPAWTPGAEPAYAALRRQSIGASDLYDAIMAADVGWPPITPSDGNPIVVSPASFPDLASNSDTTIRRAAIDAYRTHLKALETPLGLLLVRKLESDGVLARAHNYENSFDDFFGTGDGMPPGAWRVMIDAARANTPLLARYVRTVARLHNIHDIRYPELNLPAPETSRRITLDEAETVAVAAATSFGHDYVRELARVLRQPWFDFEPRPFKDDGAVGVYWQVGGGHPYGVMSYRGTPRDAQTVAAVGAITMFYTKMSATKLPERRDDDFPVYGNAVWWGGSLMAADYLLAKAGSRVERIALLAGDLRRLWDAFFKGAIDADFEDGVDRAIVGNHPPTGAELRRQYAETLRQYYGTGGLIEDLDGVEWMTLSNEYYGHVFAEWSFAIACAAVIAERGRQEDPNVIHALVAPMSNPDSFTSYDLMRDVGADPGSPSTYTALMRRMTRDMDALDLALDEPEGHQGHKGPKSQD
jgi:oligoendopeptidase F